MYNSSTHSKICIIFSKRSKLIIFKYTIQERSVKTHHFPSKNLRFLLKNLHFLYWRIFVYALKTWVGRQECRCLRLCTQHAPGRRAASVWLQKQPFFKRKSGFLISKSGFFTRESGFFRWKLAADRGRRSAHRRPAPGGTSPHRTPTQKAHYPAASCS